MTKEPFHSALPNEVASIAHLFGLSAFSLLCFKCDNCFRLLSVAFILITWILILFSLIHLSPTRGRPERYISHIEIQSTCLFFLWCAFSKMMHVSLSVLVSQEVLQMIPKFCFPFDVERYNSSPLACVLFFYLHLTFTFVTCTHLAPLPPTLTIEKKKKGKLNQARFCALFGKIRHNLIPSGRVWWLGCHHSCCVCFNPG